MNNPNNLKNNFLIAMPNMKDPSFAQSVVYVVDHSDDGAIGLVINRPMGVSVAELFTQLKIQTTRQDVLQETVFFGGPVAPERGFVLHSSTGAWRTTAQLDKEIHITTSQDILEAIALGEGPAHYIVTLGYSGWSRSQLENEIAQNAWLCCPANANLLFHTPVYLQWKNAALLLGVDITMLSGDAGHA